MILFIFGAAIFWGIGDFLLQKMTKRICSSYILIWINLAAMIGLSPFVMKEFGQLNNFKSIGTLAALSIINILYGFVVLRAYRKCKLSVAEVVFTAELPLTIALGMIFLRERPDLIQWLLIIAILAGAFLISREQTSILKKIINFVLRKDIIFEKGAAIALLAAFTSSFYNFMISVTSRDISPFMAIWFPWTLELIILFVYISLTREFKIFWKDSRKEKKLIFWGSIIDTMAWLCYAISLSKFKLSLTTAIVEVYPAISIFLAVKYNKERIGRWQYVGAAVALSASVIMSLTI